MGKILISDGLNLIELNGLPESLEERREYKACCISKGLVTAYFEYVRSDYRKKQNKVVVCAELSEFNSGYKLPHFDVYFLDLISAGSCINQFDIVWKTDIQNNKDIKKAIDTFTKDALGDTI